MLDNPSQLNAPGGTFNGIGRDQVNLYVGSVTFNVSSRSLDLRSDYGCGFYQSIPKDSTSAVFYNVEVAIRTITNMEYLLRPWRRNECQDLAQKLQSIKRSLMFTKCAIQAFEHTPLCETLVKAVLPGVEQCSELSQEIFRGVICCHDGLAPTSIYVLWHRVWRHFLPEDELASWMSKLSTYQTLLHTFLVALNLCVSLVPL